ncbi:MULTISPECIES: hypothetical protein [unclassified Streptomyces]|uniref:hypothetical protein n=1 Tax=unclassified Streptomyces TaxID=2593676 RepID=UPI0015A19219|nr:MULTISPECIES: hypothetical protein [unclassified Streptomyces]
MARPAPAQRLDVSPRTIAEVPDGAELGQDLAAQPDDIEAAITEYQPRTDALLTAHRAA